MSGFTINHVAISGNLTRDPELRSLPSGTMLCVLGVAVNERVKDQSGNWGDRANYFDVTVWGGLGESIAKQCHKGMGVAVAGRLRWESWEAKDGGKRSKVGIVADSVVPIPRREGNAPAANGAAGGYGGGQPAPGESYGQQQPVSTGAYGSPAPAAADDDIPF